MFEIQICNTLSPADLVRLSRSGIPVHRSAHIGNQYLSNMLLAAIDVPVVCFDRTMIGRDANYHPGLCIHDGRQETLATANDCLTPYAKWDEGIALSGSPANFHHRTFAELFPKMVTTESMLVSADASHLIQLLSSMHRRSFNRYVLPCGCVEYLTDQQGLRCASVRCSHMNEISLSAINPAKSFTDLSLNLVQMATNPAIAKPCGGILPTIELTIILTAAILTKASGSRRIIELSGPDMVKYVNQRSLQLNCQELWATARRSDPTLPEDLIFEVVPTADFRFGYATGVLGSKEVIETCSELLRFQKEKKRIKAETAAGELWQKLSDLDSHKAHMTERIRRNPWNIFYEIKQGTFFTQHDLARSGGELIVPDEFMEMPFGEMGLALEQLRALLRARR